MKKSVAILSCCFIAKLLGTTVCSSKTPTPFVVISHGDTLTTDIGRHQTIPETILPFKLTGNDGLSPGTRDHNLISALSHTDTILSLVSFFWPILLGSNAGAQPWRQLFVRLACFYHALLTDASHYLATSKCHPTRAQRSAW